MNEAKRFANRYWTSDSKAPLATHPGRKDLYEFYSSIAPADLKLRVIKQVDPFTLMKEDAADILGYRINIKIPPIAKKYAQMVRANSFIRNLGANVLV